MQPSIVFILSSSHSGSTWLGYVLGSSQDSAFVGEYYRAWTDAMRVPCTICAARGLETCQILHGVEKEPVEKAFDLAFSRTGKRVLVDNSKSIEWVRRFNRRNSPYDLRLLLILKDPRGYYASVKRRGRQDLSVVIADWCKQNREFRDYMRASELPHIVIGYDLLANSPAAEFRRVFDFCGMNFTEASLAYWNYEHHGFAANGASHALLKDRGFAHTPRHFATGDDAFYREKSQTLFHDRRWSAALTLSESRAIQSNRGVKKLLDSVGLNIPDQEEEEKREYSTRSAKRFDSMSDLFDLGRMLTVKDAYSLSDSDKQSAIAAASRLLQSIVGDLPNASVEANSVLDRLGERLFQHVNTKHRENRQFTERFRELWAARANPGSIHLELGTWMAWPNSRTDEYVAANNLGDVIRLDFQSQLGPDVAASVTALPFADNSIDRIESNSLFEHVAYPHEILREAHRVLRPGGVIMTTVPFHFVQHDCPSDYLRFTGAFFKDVCSEIGFEEVQFDNISASGVFYTLHNLAKGAVVSQYADRARREAFKRLHIAILALLGISQIADDEMQGRGESHFHSTAAFAVKAGDYIVSSRRFDRSTPFVERHAQILICPKTWEPLGRAGNYLVTNSGISYPIANGVPEIIVMHGRASLKGLMEENLALRKEIDKLRYRIATSA